ncbi:MAG: primosomal protein N' [Candidatus Gracilibacteria bacterium]|nr:primosomal protein N' [Candidatus Gracilibacteria bacterium]
MYYIVNLSQDKSKLNNYISNTLITKIKETLSNNKKVIVYLNRRGEYSLFTCIDCGHIYKCKNCDITMSVHKNPEILVCHMCGYKKELGLNCENCGGTNLKKLGVGTEQIEKSLRKEFPQNKIFRLDTDSVRTKIDKEQVLTRLKDADIIIGTKMITTGFDFENIALIGVILLEQEINIPKYDIEEITYNNIKQLIGRGGRQGEDKEVVIQTFISRNETIKSITEDNYKDFVTKTLEERKLFSYPPYKELVILEIYDKNEQKAKDFCNIIKNKLELSKEGKEIDLIATEKGIRKNNNYYYKIIIKGEKLRDFLELIRYEIIKNPKITLTFG